MAKKSGNNYRKKRRLRIRRLNIIIISVYLAMWCLYCYLFLSSQWGDTSRHLNKYGDKTNFATSFSASLAEDLIFFGAITLIVIILTTKSLSSYSFREKVTAMINSRDAKGNENLEDFFIKFISQNIAYTKSAELDISISAYNKEKMAYRLYIELKQVMANYCKDKNFVLEEKQYYMIYRADTEIIGYPNAVRELKKISQSGIETPYIEPADPYFLDKDCKQDVDFNIPKNENITYILKYEVWSKTTDVFEHKDNQFWNFVNFPRYTEILTIRLHNKLDLPVDFQLSKAKRLQNQEKSLTSIMAGTIQPKTSFKPSDYPKVTGIGIDEDVRVFFYTIKE